MEGISETMDSTLVFWTQKCQTGQKNIKKCMQNCTNFWLWTWVFWACLFHFWNWFLSALFCVFWRLRASPVQGFWVQNTSPESSISRKPHVPASGIPVKQKPISTSLLINKSCYNLITIMYVVKLSCQDIQKSLGYLTKDSFTLGQFLSLTIHTNSLIQY